MSWYTENQVWIFGGLASGMKAITGIEQVNTYPNFDFFPDLTIRILQRPLDT